MPLAFLITWRTYGTYLHGDADSVDPRNNVYGEPRRIQSDNLNDWERSRMNDAPFVMDSTMRTIVHHSVAEVAQFRGWLLLACNVRTNHVHVVVSTEDTPERALASMKSWATRVLREKGVIDHNRRPWSRGGSTRYLHTDEGVSNAIYYVNGLQDQPR